MHMLGPETGQPSRDVAHYCSGALTIPPVGTIVSAVRNAIITPCEVLEKLINYLPRIHMPFKQRLTSLIELYYDADPAASFINLYYKHMTDYSACN